MTLFLFLEPAIALTKYGTAQIQTGQLIIVRDEQESIYVPQDGDIEVLINDLLRVGKDSLVILKTEEQTDIKMGSNAIFQIKPWKNRNQNGYLRMLYGKMNFQTEKLEKRKRFRFKTASAMIGVKGTGADCEVGSSGNTGCTGRSGKTEILGNAGPPQELETNQMSIVVVGRPASQTIDVPADDTAGAAGGDKADAKTFAKVSPTSTQSSSLSQEDQALSAGVIEQEHLDESKKEDVAADESLQTQIEAEDQQEGEEEETDEEFEKDFKQSEEKGSIAELVVNIPVEPAVQIDIGTAATPEIPEIKVEDAIEDAVQESKNSAGKMILNFDK